MKQKVFYNEVTWMKVIATFFITWFHFQFVTPQKYAPLFIGGVIGNSLFFYASGYLLKFKEEKYIGNWIINKCIRILPSIWVFSVIACLISFGDYNIEWYNFLYPTQFWFVNCILCYFVLIYFAYRILRLKTSSNVMGGHVLVVLGALTMIGFVWNYIENVNHTRIVLDEGGFKCWFYFFFFLWGYYDHSEGRKFIGNRKSVFWFMLSIILFYTCKKIGGRYETMIYMQFVFIPLLLANMLYHARYLVNFLMQIHIPIKMQSCLGYIANLTLDIYIVQVLIIQVIGNQLPFPLNILVLLIIIFIASVINHKIASRISDALTSILK